MEKIRIGNDIRLAVDLRQFINRGYLKERDVYNPEDEDYENIDSNPYVNKAYETYYPNQYTTSTGSSIQFESEGTPVSIRRVKAILVNTTQQDNYKAAMRKRKDFVARFPIEPYCNAFCANPYNVCTSGYPTWRAYPHGFNPVVYTGFGLNPQFGGLLDPMQGLNDSEYIAEVSATKQQNVVEVSFPAIDQRNTGVYKLIIVAQLYAPGFNSKNLKTITVDIPGVFELVSTSEEGVDTGIWMNVQQVIDKLPQGDDSTYVQYDDVYVNSGSYNDNYITLNRTNGTNVKIDVSGIIDWYEAD